MSSVEAYVRSWLQPGARPRNALLAGDPAAEAVLHELRAAPDERVRVMAESGLQAIAALRAPAEPEECVFACAGR